MGSVWVRAPCVGCGLWFGAEQRLGGLNFCSALAGMFSPEAHLGGGAEKLLLSVAFMAVPFFPSLCHVHKLFYLGSLNLLIHKTETNAALGKGVTGPLCLRGL